MNNFEYTNFTKLSMKNHPAINERWVQDRIADDPSMLGLGELFLKDKEIIQPKAGRLDLLLQDSENNTRYEVEIQLGKVDESHIVRTIEYWDIEKKRYPQYDHVAVIIAEDITSRFLNVISLFNGFIPLVAIQMNAYQYENKVSLICSTILDQINLGYDSDDEDQELTDRAYWEKRATAENVSYVDKLLELIYSFDSNFELTYKKFYIGLAKSGIVNNFVVFRPKKKYIRIDFKLSRSEEVHELIENSSLELIDHTKQGRYRVRLSINDFNGNKELLADLFQRSYDEHGK